MAAGRALRAARANRNEFIMQWVEGGNGLKMGVVLQTALRLVRRKTAGFRLVSRDREATLNQSALPLILRQNDHHISVEK